tara:strand:- start:12584 stop:13561 length:978 start_codon:yes stop_codon:yes gene_type:complete
MRDAAIWYEQNNQLTQMRAIHEVLKFRLDAASAAYRVPIDLENIEELFSLASAANHKIEKDVRISIAATLEYCRGAEADPLAVVMNAEPKHASVLKARSVKQTLDNQVSTIPLYDALALRFLKALSPKNSTVISFNYDDLVEKSVINLGGTFHYGIATKHENQIGSSYHGNGLAVLKMHGSLNWAYADKREANFTVFEDAAAVLKAGLVPQIVPPTWNKTIAKKLAEVWSSAITRLETATRIYVVGFSMPQTDMHFKYLLAAGLQKNFSLREIVFVDPSDTIPTRAGTILASREIQGGRVKFLAQPICDMVAKRVKHRFGAFRLS